MALQESMREDSTIIIMGEDVGRYGGAYGVTKGLIEEFGEKRILDTPISEEGIVGSAVGSAMTGLRPVMADPTALPTILSSEIGVSRILFSPNSSIIPLVTP